MQRLEEILAEARRQPTPEAQAAYLDQVCAHDPALRAQIEQLLRALDAVDSLSKSYAIRPPLPEQSDSAAKTLPGANYLSAPAAPGKTTDLKLGASGFPPSSPLLEGAVPVSQIGQRYRVMHLLGEGGMGSVYLAEQLEPIRRLVALKLIRGGLDNHEVLARFEAERQALAMMDHPHIAKVLDAGMTPEGRPFFVMELVQGQPLTDYCNLHRLTLRERLELFLPVCQAVQHAHLKGIIHRDLKALNVLVSVVDGQPTPKVIDFGVAKAVAGRLAGQWQRTEVGTLVGTPEYMAPEQADLANTDIDTRADIYALGGLLYELLTGQMPLVVPGGREAPLLEVLRHVREVEPIRPSLRLAQAANLPTLATQRGEEPKRLVRQVAGDLDWITMKCLEKDRARRYETANALALDLKRYLQDEPVLAGPPSTGYRLGKFLRRHRGKVTMACILLMILVAGIVGTTWGMMLAFTAERAALRERDQKEDARREALAQRDRAVKAEREARAQADVAAAVNDFLQHDLLGQADLANQEGSTHGRDPNVKVLTLVDEAAKRLDDKFPDQPLTEAALRLTVGTTYMALLEYAEAQLHLQRSIDLRTVHLGADHPDTLVSRFRFAVLTRLQEKFDRAEELGAEVLRQRIAVLGGSHDETMASKSEMGVLYYYQHKEDLAGPLLREVLAHRQANLGANHPETLAAMNHLARLHTGQRAFDRAEPLFEQVLRQRVALFGHDHPATWIIKHDLALTYLARGKFAAAAPLLQEALRSTASAYGEDHPRTLICKGFLAMLCREEGQHVQAEALFQEVLRGQALDRGAAHNDWLFTKRQYALLLQAQGKYAEAETLLREVLRKRAAHVPPGHPEPGYHMQRLALLCQLQGKYAEAETLLREALQVHAARAAADHPRLLTGKHALAGLYLAWDKPDQAAPLLHEVVQQRTAKFGNDHLDTLLAQGDLAALLEVQGETTAAEALRREVLAGLRRQLPADHLLLAGTLADLGRALLKQGRFAEAEPLLRESSALREKRQPDSWLLFDVKSLLGGALLGQGKLADAEPFLRQGHAGLKQRRAQIPPHFHRRLTEAQDRLAQLDKDRGRSDAATQVGQELTLGKDLAQTPEKK